MCRSKELGGRRCPSHSDPVKHAAYNALRRERYAAQKNNTILTSSKETVVTTASLEPLPHYRDYGFTNPAVESRAHEEVENDVQLAESKAEMKKLNKEQRNAVSIFTSNNYKWINGALYGMNSFLREEGYVYPRNPNLSVGFEKPVAKMAFEETKFRVETTPSQAADYINLLDKAMHAAPLKSRVVYRGVAEHSEHIDYDVSGYIKKNYSLGQEVVFDAYQSTTTSPTTAVNYAREDGIIFEMKTISGVNAHAISHYEDEQEIVIPRQTRWKVVGVHENVKYSTRDKKVDATVVQMVEIDDSGSEQTKRIMPEPVKAEHFRKSIIPSN
jgi:hypothetical protein